MDSKKVALTAILSALTIILNPAVSHISIPAPYFPLISYEIWEIPLVMIILLIGFKVGFVAAAINGVFLLAFFPRPTTVGSIIASFAMLLGIFIIYKLLTRNLDQGHAVSSKKIILSSTLGAIIFRTLIMAFVNYSLLRYPFPLGLNLPEPAILAFMPFVAIFNLTEPLYVVPFSFLIAKTITGNFALNNNLSTDALQIKSC